MLVLSRRISQSIMIGDNIEVTVVRIAGNRVRIGVSAPANIRILRSELDETDASVEFQRSSDMEFCSN